MAYVYGIALSDAGHGNQAIKVLEDEVHRHPYDRDALGALVGLYLNAKNPAQALACAERLAKLEPDNPQLQQLLTQLRTGTRRRIQ